MRVPYVGKLLTGTKTMFASSFHTGSTPFKFKLGSSDVIDAWNRGLLGMCEGARARPRHE
jgi:FKBP-type peptidyl-prolyl cis-trans isomerase